jgi:CheY-specific phosphatase CheX
MALIDLRNEKMHAACQQAVLEVLETMFFELPESTGELVEHHVDDASLVTARFSGSLNGVLCVALSSASPQRLAAGFLGMEEEDIGPDEEHSMVVELANVLCGSTMSRVEPLGRLIIEQPGVGEHPEDVHGPWLRFPLESGLIEVSVQYEGH